MGGAGPAPTPSGPGTGGYVGSSRGPTSREELKIDWQHPVYLAESVATGGTVAAQAERALPLAEAFAAVAESDPRPLLVLRECLTCTGTDDALLTRNTDNEKTMLMSRWFRCVKLPPDVLEPDHPFHALFAGDEPGHLFLSNSDGSDRRDLKGDQARVELWRLMEARLAASYEDEPRTALKSLGKCLDRLDRLDTEIGRVQQDLDDAAEKSGPGSGKFRKVKAKLTALQAERSELRAEALRASQLALREDRERESGSTKQT